MRLVYGAVVVGIILGDLENKTRIYLSSVADPDQSIFPQKSKKYLDFYCFCDFFMTFYL
jgi:hypothetical protein